MARDGAHVIVVGNEKGGSGKSTTAFHLAVYLLYAGHRVATIDVDSRQQTLTHYVRNRRAHAQEPAASCSIRCIFTCRRPGAIRSRKTSRPNSTCSAVRWGGREQGRLPAHRHARFDTNLTRLAHSLADTLVTPVNDSLIDINVLARIDPETGLPVETSHYAVWCSVPGPSVWRLR